MKFFSLRNKKGGDAHAALFCLWGEKTYFFFSRNPAANMATAASSHSMRHNWTAYQSRRAVAVNTKPVTMAAFTQAHPRISATGDAVVFFGDSRSESMSLQARIPGTVISARLAFG